METPTPSERGDASLLPRPLSIAEIVSPDDQPIVNPSLRRAGTRTSLSLAQLTRGATAAKQRLPVARAFADEVVTYILSQQWYDLVFVHIFRLRPTPYCCPASKSPEEEVLLQMVLEQCTAAEEHAIPCPPESNSGLLFVSGGLLLVAMAAVDWRVCARRGAEKTSTRLLRVMMGMCIGWAFGHATVQLMDEVDDTACAAGADTFACAKLRFGFAAVVTVLAALALYAIKPRSVAWWRDRCGGGARGARAAEYANSLWWLTKACVSTLVMVLWNAALSEAILSTDDPIVRVDQLHALHDARPELCRARNISCAPTEAATSLLDDVDTYRALVKAKASSSVGFRLPLTKRLTVLWAIAVYFGFAWLVVRAVRLRRWLTRRAEEPPAGAGAAAPAAPAPAAAGGVAAALRSAAGASVQLLLLFESTAGWVTGCAFTDAVTTVSGTLSASPKESPTVWLADVAIAVAFTIFAFGWLALAHVPSPKAATSAYHDDAQKVQREVIEKDFLTEALSFAVGWGYIVSLRDVSYLLGRVLGRDSEGWTRMAQILIVLLVGTTLTLLLMLLVELPSLIGRRLLSRRGGSLTPAEGLRESLANPDAS